MRLMSFHVGAFAGMSRGGPPPGVGYDGHVACLRENQPLHLGTGGLMFPMGFGMYPCRWKDQGGQWRPAGPKLGELDQAGWAVTSHVRKLLEDLRLIRATAMCATPDGKPFDLFCVDYEGGESDELPSLGARLRGPRGSEWRRFLRLTADLCESQLPGRTGFYDLRAISGDESFALPTVVEEGRNFVCCYPFIESQDVMHKSILKRLWSGDIACVSARWDTTWMLVDHPMRADHGKPVPDEVLAAVLSAVKARLGGDAVLAHWGEADSVTAAHALQAEAGRIREMWGKV